MTKLWAALTVLFVALGVWMVAVAPVGERLLSAIPFLFWILLFGALTVRAWKRRPKISKPDITKMPHPL
jgi:hypothetical protein